MHLINNRSQKLGNLKQGETFSKIIGNDIQIFMVSDEVDESQNTVAVIQLTGDGAGRIENLSIGSLVVKEICSVIKA